MRRGSMSKTDYVDVTVDIDISDVIDFIVDYANEDDLEDIRGSLNEGTLLPTTTMVDVMKIDLFKVASEKYTLEQLEEMLDIKYY